MRPRVEVRHELDLGVFGETRGSLAAPRDSRHDADPTADERDSYRAAHGAGADDADGRHGRARQQRVTWAETASQRPSRRAQTSVYRPAPAWPSAWV